MNIKSYYITKNDIVIKDYENKTTILELNRQNLMNMINDLDTQVKESADEIISKEDQAYRKLINVLSINTLASLFLSLIVFLGFTHASYIGMVLGIILSLGLVVYSLVMTFLGAKKIRGYRKQYRIYEGREILLNMYNKLSKGLDAELVDVY